MALKAQITAPWVFDHPFDLQTWVKAAATFDLPDINSKIRLPAPRIFFADGVSVSIQASEHTYATPRNNEGPYTHFEVGYPSERPPETWKQHAEDWENPTETVYSYVPIEMLIFYIAAHGGVDMKKTEENNQEWITEQRGIFDGTATGGVVPPPT